MTTLPLITRLEAHDHAWYFRLRLPGAPPRRSRTRWMAITHLGGTTATVIAAALPLFGVVAGSTVGPRAALALAVSFLVAQALKRTATRRRPCERLAVEPITADPDHFSFPSGHSCAAMAIALAWASAYPVAAGPLIGLAALVGVSRVRLGVHYPGDVLAGQAIALVTWMVVG